MAAAKGSFSPQPASIRLGASHLPSAITVPAANRLSRCECHFHHHQMSATTRSASAFVRQRRVSSRRFVWPVLLTLIGGWVVHTSQRTPFGFLQALVWLAVVIFVWAHALWRRRG
jgi:hypothetical protein